MYDEFQVLVRRYCSIGTMPLLKRLVWPDHVSRVPIVEEWVRDESGRVFSALMPATDAPQDLEAFTNLTLSNLITQVWKFISILIVLWHYKQVSEIGL